MVEQAVGTEPRNLKQVAAELGVHYMTAYRYVRTGRMHAEKVGNGWVVQAEDLQRFLDEAEGPTIETDQGGTAWHLRLADALVTGDEPAAWRVVEQALASGRTPTQCYLEVLSDALTEIGAPSPDDDTSQEFLATATAARLVARLGGRFRRPGRSRGTVVFGAPVGELHSLPIAIVADLVRMEGFTCLELGANVPSTAFAHAAQHAPDLVAVGIGVTTVANIDAVRDTIEAVRELSPDVPILLGGQAVLSPEIAALNGATHWAANGAEAVGVIADLAVARRAAPDASPT
ncbi:MAG: cobalamin-dependent protein [Aquihabitans sp.]